MSAPIDALARGGSAIASHPGNGSGSSFANVLERTLRAADAAPSVQAISAEPDARAALELQAAVYRHAEQIELASRLVDHCVGSVKTILQTRV